MNTDIHAPHSINSRRGYKQATINAQYRVHVGSAKYQESPPLEKEIWIKLVLQPCHYCGKIDIRNEARNVGYKRKLPCAFSAEEEEKYTVQMNGVDRLDSNKGYTPDNCVPCCMFCNRMKMHYSVDQFYDNVQSVYQHQRLDLKNLTLK